ncbi:hypothetical protein [Phaeobacter gallaeciensis]|uniref:hypothetical protein n=1 Tax=Phaeobacter gallaeciensis TaxID=60890 RepID=UPI000BC067E8|nr:hypothetical protein [Phaeobacter gallaeciensis]ATF17835.1 hypothetical protein PhaeoP129_01193 [Phaeobacter gallaeciensis]ATF21944.1 hypothetical protein PhaeoP128_01193 [Phaeobacter gallaeciensis]
MNFSVNFNSIGGLFRALRSPSKEISVPIRSGSMRLQQRGTDADPIYCLRMGGFGRVSYYEFDGYTLSELQKAIVQITSGDDKD